MLQVIQFLITFGLLTESPFGILKNKSTGSALLTIAIYY